MRRILPCLLAATAGLAAGGPALAQSGGPRAPGSPPPCFETRQIVSRKAPDDRTLYIRAKARDVYRIDFARNCRNIHRQDVQLSLRTRGIGDRVCRPIDLQISSNEQGLLTACDVSAITPLPYAEAERLPKQAKP